MFNHAGRRLVFTPTSAHPATNMNRDINKYLKLQTALVNEKAKLEARLSEISKVLGGDSVAAASSALATSTPATTTTPGGAISFL